MPDERAPYLVLPLRLEGGRMASGSLEDSIAHTIRLVLTNPVQGAAKPPGTAGDPDFGADLPHHEFRQGRAQDVVREIRNALGRCEPRIVVDKIEFTGKDPGRYFPYRRIRVVATVRATRQLLTLDYDLEA
jgi:phage baseplate assembly protein W